MCMHVKQEALGLISSGCLGFFSSSSWLTNVDGMKDLVVWLLSGYRDEWKGLWCSSTVQLLSA